MHSEQSPAGQRVRKRKIALALKLPDLFICHNGVDHLLYVERAGQVVGKKVAFRLSRAGACQQRLTGAEPQIAAAGLERFVEQFINRDIV